MAEKSVIVIDGMGGGIGVALIIQLRKNFNSALNIIALGTNAVATERMMQAKAHRGAAGDNAIRCNINHADVILGPIGIILPNGLMGEVAKETAEAVMNSRGKKILIPVNHPGIKIIGTEENVQLSRLIEDAMSELKKLI